MKKRILLLTIVIFVLSASQTFGVIQKISKMSVSDIDAADTSEYWMTVTGTADAIINFKFQNEDTISLYLGSGYSSLSTIVDAINTESLNQPVAGDGTPTSYVAAYIVDSVVTPGEYSLMLVSRTDSAIPMEAFTTSSANATLAGNFGPLGTDLTGDNMYFFGAIPEPATGILLGLGVLALIKKRKKMSA